MQFLIKWVFNPVVLLCLKYKNKGEDMYYNTTNQGGKQLKLNWDKAINQKQKVLGVFQLTPTAHYCPDDVLMALKELNKKDNNAPITSIRRAISDLTKDGYLVKTDRKVMGNWGRLTYTWKLR